MFPVSRADSAIPPRDRMSQWFRPLRAGRWRFFYRQIGKRSGDWVIGKAKAHRGDAEARRRKNFLPQIYADRRRSGELDLVIAVIARDPMIEKKNLKHLRPTIVSCKPFTYRIDLTTVGSKPGPLNQNAS